MLNLLRSLLTCRTPVTMVNLGRLIAVVTYVILSVHYTAAASDVVNGLTFYKELEKLQNEVLGVKKMQVGVVPSCSLVGASVSSQLSFTSVGNCFDAKVKKLNPYDHSIKLLLKYTIVPKKQPQINVN